jgi:hypothetical protein
MASGDGLDSCKDVPSGGCDFRDAEECGLGLASPDELVLDGGKVIRGKWLNTGIFAVRSCTGEQRDVIYIASELDRRRQLARTIAMTVDDE